VENRIRACQNLILSGGTCIIPGFKKRLLQEIHHLIDHDPSFNELRAIKDLIAVPEVCFPSNTLVWVGASLLSSLNNEIDRFLFTYEDYRDAGFVVPDRFGRAFMTAERKDEYFNHEFEENLKLQKQILYSNTTPYSARSLASKRESIASMLKKSLNMETPKSSKGQGGMFKEKE